MGLSIGIVGSGNLATHLSKRFIECGIPIAFIQSRNVKTGKALAKACRSIFVKELPETSTTNQILFICSSDSSIEDIFQANHAKGYSLVHNSGMIPLLHDKKNKTKSAVFYPVQTFSKKEEVDWKAIPICIESNDKKLEQKLLKLARKIAGSALILDSKQRAYLHLAAVFANNFVNANYAIATNILASQKLPAKLIAALIQQTAKNALNNSPQEIQTGPAKRKDLKTIQAHLQLLKKNPKEKKVYDAITEYLLKK